MTKALFLVGAPGSGKDFLLRALPPLKEVTEIPLDKLTQAIADQTDIDEIDGRDIIVNGVAERYKEVKSCKGVLESMGYQTAMVYVYTTNEASKARNDFRISRQQKTFTEAARAEKYQAALGAMQNFSMEFEPFWLFNNSSQMGMMDEEVKGWLNELNSELELYLECKKQKPVPTWGYVREKRNGEWVTVAKAVTETYFNEEKTHHQLIHVLRKNGWSMTAAHSHGAGNRSHSSWSVEFQHAQGAHRNIQVHTNRSTHPSDGNFTKAQCESEARRRAVHQFAKELKLTESLDETQTMKDYVKHMSGPKIPTSVPATSVQHKSTIKGYERVKKDGRWVLRPKQASEETKYNSLNRAFETYTATAVDNSQGNTNVGPNGSPTENPATVMAKVLRPRKKTPPGDRQSGIAYSRAVAPPVWETVGVPIRPKKRDKNIKGGAKAPPNFFDSRMGMVPSGSLGITSEYKPQGRSLSEIRKGKDNG